LDAFSNLGDRHQRELFTFVIAKHFKHIRIRIEQPKRKTLVVEVNVTHEKKVAVSEYITSGPYCVAAVT